MSYARNAEDVLLYRALNHLQCGFYIDVGAAEPETNSVTCGFYERGWRGINLEPAPGAFKRLVEARPRDTNLNLIAGERNGTASLVLAEGRNGLPTAAPSGMGLVDQQASRSDETRIAVRTLASIVDEHASGPVHFLRIDAGGSERQVLLGANLKQFRPWIIVIKATALDLQVRPHPNWEDLLLVADYQFVWFDGLNRFYVSAERKELQSALETQPNVFDNFLRHSELRAVAQLALAQSDLADVIGREQAAHAASEEAHRALSAARVELAEQHDLAAKLNAESANLRTERDIWMQELFETNRYSAYLAQARQTLLDSVQRFESDMQRVESERKDLETEVQRVESERKLLEGEVLRVESERQVLEREVQRVESERRSLARELLRLGEERRKYEVELQAPRG